MSREYPIARAILAETGETIFQDNVDYYFSGNVVFKVSGNKPKLSVEQLKVLAVDYNTYLRDSDNNYIFESDIILAKKIVRGKSQSSLIRVVVPSIYLIRSNFYQITIMGNEHQNPELLLEK